MRKYLKGRMKITRHRHKKRFGAEERRLMRIRKELPDDIPKRNINSNG